MKLNTVNVEVPEFLAWGEDHRGADSVSFFWTMERAIQWCLDEDWAHPGRVTTPNSM